MFMLTTDTAADKVLGFTLYSEGSLLNQQPQTFKTMDDVLAYLDGKAEPGDCCWWTFRDALDYHRLTPEAWGAFTTSKVMNVWNHVEGCVKQVELTTRQVFG